MRARGHARQAVMHQAESMLRLGSQRGTEPTMSRALPLESSVAEEPADLLTSAGPRATAQERYTRGRAIRGQLPRRAHAGWTAPASRRDPISVLEAQASDRLPDLVGIRYGRMLASPFAFYRGGAAIMAADLAATPVTGVTVQLCGDAHLSNFGQIGRA